MNTNPQPIRPTIGKNVFIASTAYGGGEVSIGDDCSRMHHVVIRGDMSAIRIGRRSIRAYRARV